MMQRFRAVKMAESESNQWDLAQHLELIPHASVTSIPEEMRQVLIRQQVQHEKLRVAHSCAA